jgi:cysteine synthase
MGADASHLPQDILHRIGNTALVPLRNITPRSGSRILLKLESENPSGSMKDRMALAMIEAAERASLEEPPPAPTSQRLCAWRTN